MIKYKFVSLILLMSCLFLIASCSGENENGQKEVTEEAITIKYVRGFMPETPHHRAAVEFKEEVELESAGQTKVDIYPADELGVAQKQFADVKSGKQEIALLSIERISQYVPELQLFELPFLFPDRKTAYKLKDGDFGQELLEFLEKKK